MQNDVLTEEFIENEIIKKQKRRTKQSQAKAVLLTIIESILLLLEIIVFVFLGVLNILMDDKLLAIIFISIGLLLVSIFANCILFLLNVLILKKNMRDVYYGLDYLEEIKIYKNIGISTRRKKAMYKNSKCVQFINYSEWEMYIKTKYKLRKNEKNFFHYLILLSRGKKSLIDSMKAIVIPIEIAMISALSPFDANTWINKLCIVILSVFCVIYFTIEIEKYKIESDFYKDFMDIVFPELIENNLKEKDKA